MGRNLDPLKRRGLVSVTPGAVDPRERRVSLTASGREALAAATPYWREAQSRINARVDPATVSAVAEALISAA